MRMPSLRFSTILVAIGGLLTVIVVGDLLLRGTHRFTPDPRWQVPGGDPARGRNALIQFGCGACHTIPGVRGATGRVGPQLVDFRQQVYIAGQLPNTPTNLVAWIRDPQHYSPGSAMPNLNVAEQDARDIAAYLYSR